ncbi:hypothetical protein Tco_0177688, partial [Tanacetum coccineum]
ISSSSLRSQNQGLVSQVHELETSSARLREQLDLYEGNMKRLEEFQDNLIVTPSNLSTQRNVGYPRAAMFIKELNAVDIKLLSAPMSNKIDA